MKLVTFEEFCKDNKIVNAAFAEFVWNSARKDMVESVSAYHIPIDWNSRPWATYVKVAYCTKETPKTNDRCGDVIMTINRPVPVWEPKKDDPVFVLNQGFLCTGTVHVSYSDGTNIRVNGSIRDYPKHLVKPFNPKYIGAEWDVIPSF